jgi:hypothetical protein
MQNPVCSATGTRFGASEGSALAIRRRHLCLPIRDHFGTGVAAGSTCARAATAKPAPIVLFR